MAGKRVGGLTFIYSYYSAPQNLQRQLALWGDYPRNLRRRLRIVLVDDASPEPLKIPGRPVLNLSVYRIAEDLGWNNGGARNLGAHVAPAGWLFLSDIDHYVPAETCRRMLELVREADPSQYYTFRRLCQGRLLPWPPNIFFVHRTTFWRAGGYDEDLSGHYGGEDVLIRALLDRSCQKVELPWEIEVERNTSYARPADEPDRRDLEPNNRRVQEKLATVGYRPERPLRFGWKKVADYRAQGEGNRRARSRKCARAQLRRYHRAARLAVQGQYARARRLYGSLSTNENRPRLAALVRNDLAALAALKGDFEHSRAGFRAALELDAGCEPARQNLSLLEMNDGVRLAVQMPAVHPSVPHHLVAPGYAGAGKVAILSLLFNWPSTGGGIVHTVELARFLAKAGYEVEHFYARHPAWGVGRVEEPPGIPSTAIDFDEANWDAETIQSRFRREVDRFGPDWVLVTDSWNFKPLLAEAMRGYPYFLRFQAMECLCPLNNVRLLVNDDGNVRQCPKHQLATPDDCAGCVKIRGRFSGELHQAERALSGVGTRDYYDRLRRVLAEAEAALVVNPLMEAMVAPYARRVRVVTAGIDPARFPWRADCDETRPCDGQKKQVFFAGLVHELMKGYDVLHRACAALWQRRRDFELVATGEPPGQMDEFTRFVGWLSQDELAQHLHGSDICVVPTVAQEALGRTAVEAMAAGRPVVASRIGGLQFTVADGATGLLAEPGDAEGLARKIETLLDDPELGRRMGQAGRRRFEEHYAWPVVIERHYRPLFDLALKKRSLVRS